MSANFNWADDASMLFVCAGGGFGATQDHGDSSDDEKEQEPRLSIWALVKKDKLQGTAAEEAETVNEDEKEVVPDEADESARREVKKANDSKDELTTTPDDVQVTAMVIDEELKSQEAKEAEVAEPQCAVADARNDKTPEKAPTRRSLRISKKAVKPTNIVDNKEGGSAQRDTEEKSAKKRGRKGAQKGTKKGVDGDAAPAGVPPNTDAQPFAISSRKTKKGKGKRKAKSIQDNDDKPSQMTNAQGKAEDEESQFAGPSTVNTRPAKTALAVKTVREGQAKVKTISLKRFSPVDTESRGVKRKEHDDEEEEESVSNDRDKDVQEEEEDERLAKRARYAA